MKRTRITDTIAYIEPEIDINSIGCSGIVLSSRPKISIDCNVEVAQRQAFLSSEKPDIAIASHYHLDHWPWMKMAQDLCGSHIFVPEGEEANFKNLDRYVEQSVAVTEKELRPAWKDIARHIGGYQALERFDSHHHDQVFRSGTSTIRCIKAPGHSPSHTCFYFPKEKILYTADMGIGKWNPWYGHRDCDLRKFVDSVLRLQSLEADLILTSHGGIIRNHTGQAWNRCLKQFLSFIDMWARIMVDHHDAVLQQGGAPVLFP
jgi:hydroxyacylglutathione hydrolase